MIRGFQRDLRGALARGIARAVVALVVVEHPLGLDRELRGDEDRVSDLHVAGHLRALAAVERVRLAQDLVCDAELADVVEEPRQAKAFELMPRHAEPLADRDAQGGDRFGVASGAGLLRVQCARQCGGPGALFRRRPGLAAVDRIDGSREAGVEHDRVEARSLRFVEREVCLADDQEPALGRDRLGQPDRHGA